MAFSPGKLWRVKEKQLGELGLAGWGIIGGCTGQEAVGFVGSFWRQHTKKVQRTGRSAWL